MSKEYAQANAKKKKKEETVKKAQSPSSSTSTKSTVNRLSNKYGGGSSTGTQQKTVKRPPVTRQNTKLPARSTTNNTTAAQADKNNEVKQRLNNKYGGREWQERVSIRNTKISPETAKDIKDIKDRAQQQRAISEKNRGFMQRQKSGIQTEADKQRTEEMNKRWIEIAKNTGAAAKKGVQDAGSGFGKSLADLDEMVKSNENWSNAKAMKMGLAEDDIEGRAKIEAERQQSIKEAKALREDLGKKQDERQAEWDERTKNAKGLEKAWYGAVESGTGMAVDAAVGTVTGTGQFGSLASMGLRTYGQTRGQAEKEGATESEDRLYSFLQAGKEVGTELMFPGAGLARKAYGRAGLSVADKTAKILTRNLTGKTADIVGAGIRLFGGTVEENAEELAGWGLDPLIKEFAYGKNVRQRMAEALRAGIPEITNQAEAEKVASYFSTSQFTDELTKEYVEAGMSKEDASELAAEMRDYYVAYYSGDEKTFEKLENDIAGKLSGQTGVSRRSWSMSELADTFASTTLLTMVTGAPGAVKTSVKGNQIFESPEVKAAFGDDAVKLVADAVRNSSDADMAIKAESMLERLESGKDLTGTQKYDLWEGYIDKVNETAKKAEASDRVVRRAISDNNYVPIMARDRRTGQRFYAKATQAEFEGKYDSALGVVDTIGRYLKADNSITDTEGRRAEAVAEAVADLHVGGLTVGDAHEFAYGNNLARETLKAEEGIDLDQYVVYKADGTVDYPATNEATENALFEISAANAIESAKKETDVYIDTTKGAIDTDLMSRLGAEGQAIWKDINQDLDPRDMNKYLTTANAASTLYAAGRNTTMTVSEAVDQFAGTLKSVDKNVLRRAFAAGARDRIKANTPGYGHSVEAGSNIAMKDTKPILTGNLIIEEGLKLPESTQSAYLALAQATNTNIHLVASMDILDKDGNPVLSKDGQTMQMNGESHGNEIYLNVNANAEQNLGYVFMHEMTHQIKQYAPNQYMALENLVRDKWFRQDHQGMQKAIKDKQALYKRYARQELSEEDALEEIIADAMAEAIDDPNFAAEVCEQDESLGQAVLNSIKAALRSIRRMFAGKEFQSDRFHNGLLSYLGILDQAERMWMDALAVAKQNKADGLIADWDARSRDDSRLGDEIEAADARYSIVEDPETIKALDADKHRTTYRAMAQIDGKLYPPMSTQVRDENGNWALQQGIEIGQWVESDATTDSKMFNAKGQYLLRKDNGKIVPAAYNPYIHSSDTMLNDQFASAYQRPNLVVVEGEIPESELSNGIPAETTLDDGRVIIAKDAPGVVNWKAGVVQGKLTGTRTVFLTNHFKPTRIVPDAEVAESIRDMVADTDVAIPYNVVTPSVREELRNLGVKMEQSSNKNYQVRFSLPEYTQEEMDEHRQYLIDTATEFYDEPYTEDPNESGFILPDGKLPRMGMYGSRADDHNLIIGAYDDIGYDTSMHPKADAMARFLNEGNIRYMPENGTIEFGTEIEPTYEQYARIRSMDYVNMIEFTNPEGETVDFKEYDGNRSGVINDIKRFYREGQIGGSQLSQFRYSLSSTAEAVGTTITKKNGKLIFTDDKGEVIEHFTPEIIKNTPIGRVLGLSASKAFNVMSDEAVNERLEFLSQLLNLISNTQDPDLIWAVSGTLGYNPNNPINEATPQDKIKEKKSKFASITGNSDPQYQTTIDFTTICVKTQAVIDAMSATMKQLHRGLTEHEIIDIVYNETKMAGEQVPCPVCYVFSRWVGLGNLFTNIKRFQEKYPADMDMSEIRKTYNNLTKQVDKIANDLGIKGGDARAVLDKQIRQRIEELEELQWLYKAQNKGQELTDEQKAELYDLKAKNDVLDHWSWLGKTRLADDYKEIPDDILFDINAGREFATEYPAVWRYRTTRGPSLGKAAAPYSPSRLGDTIRGIASPSSLKKIGEGTRPFLSKKGIAKGARNTFKKAILNAKRQNRMNGQRLQSTSDFRFEYGLDYLLSMLELEAIGAKAQMYTKVPEAVKFLASTKAEVNCSIMAKGTGLDENGNLVFSDVTGMSWEDALALSKAYDNVQPILVAIGPEHLRAAMASKDITMIIPYHASGSSEARYVSMMRTVEEAVMNRTDFAEYESEHDIENATKEQKHCRKLRVDILTGKFEKSELSDKDKASLASNEILRQLYIRVYGKDETGKAAKPDPKYVENFDENDNDADCFGVYLTKAQANVMMPYEYWDKHSTIDSADAQGKAYVDYCASLGITPVFSGWDSKGKYDEKMDFSKDPGYWKTLIDRCMYNNDGSYHKQNAVNLSDVDLNMLDSTQMRAEVHKPLQVNDPEKTAGIANKSMARIAAETGEEYTPISSSTKFSIQADFDNDYMDAVTAGNMEEAQRLVNEAAKRAFPNSKLIQDGEFFAMWHHTNADFNSFLPGTSPSSGRLKGIYFTPQEHSNTANLGTKHGKYYLNVENPKFAFSVEADKEYVNRLREMQEGVTDREELEQINRQFKEETGVDAFYDWQNGWYNVMTPEQIKSADTVTYAEDGSVIPLSERFDPANNDIRYSMPTMDSEDNILSDGQMEYFKNSQARDEKGRLIPMYHVTPNGGFTIFDPSYSSDGISLSFTNDIDFAVNYASEDEDIEAQMQAYETRLGDGETQGLGHYKVYLNMVNPMIVDASEIEFNDEVYDLTVQARDEGYDGLIMRNFQDLGADVYQVFSGTQVKDVRNTDPTNNPDIRYSLTDPDEARSQQAYDDAWDNSYEELSYYEAISGDSEVEADNYIEKVKRFSEAKMNAFYEGLNAYEDHMVFEDPVLEEGRARMAKSRNDYMARLDSDWNQAWISNGEVLNIKTVEKDIRKLVMATMKNSDTDRQYKADVVKKTLLDVRTAYEYAAKGRTDVADALLWHSAKRMIENIDFINDETFNQYKDLRDYLRTTRISLGEEYWNDVDYSAFRKENFGRMKLVKGDTNVDDVYMEMCELWPEWFKEDDELTPPDQLERMAHVLDAIQPYKEAYTSEEAAALTSDIADALYNILKNGKPIESIGDQLDDKGRRQLQGLYNEFDKRMAAAVADVEAGYEARIEGLNNNFDEQTEAMKQRHEEALRKVEEEKAVMEDALNTEIDELKRKAEEDFHYLKYVQATERAERMRIIAERDARMSAKRKERTAHSKYFKQIKKLHKNLTERLMTNTVDKHIPEQYKRELAKLLAAFDLQTTRSKSIEANRGYKAMSTLKLGAIKATLQAIEEKSEEFHVNDAITNLFDELLGPDGVEGKTIDALDSVQLRKIRDLLQGIVHEFNTYESVRKGAKRQQTADVATAQIDTALAHAETYGPGKDYFNFVGALDKIVNMDEMTAAYLFKRIDPNREGLGGMYRELRRSFDKYVRNQNQLNEWMEEIVGPYHNKGIINKYGSGELADWRSSNYARIFDFKNGSVTLTPAQMMSIYCLSKRQQAYSHMTGAGIIVAPVSFQAKMMSDLKKKADMSLPIILTDDNIKTIVSQLTKEQIKVADQLQKLMATKMADWGNEASMSVIGIKLFNEPDYFPIKSDKAALTKDLNEQEFVEAIRNFGFTKAVKPGARNAIMVDDIFDVVAEHCNNMNLYNSYSESINDFMKVYNYRQVRDDGREYTVQQAIAHAYSRKATTFIMRFMRDLNGNVSGKDNTGIEAMLNGALSNAKKASVFANGRVLLQQPTAIFRAFAVIDPKYVKGIRVEKGAMKEMFEHCPIAMWKMWGNYDINMSKSIEDIMMNNGSITEDVMTELYGKADNITWTAIWQMVKAEIKEKHPNVKEGSDEFWDLCNERMTDIVDLTQVVDSPFHRSHAMRSKGFMTKLMTSFMSEPTLTFNMVRDGIQEAHEAYKVKDYGRAGKALGRTLAVFAIQAAAVSAASAIWDAIRGKDPGDGDDDDDEKWYERFGRLWQANFFENMKDNINLLNNIYYVKDVASIFGGWGSKNLAMQGWETLYSGIRSFDKKLYEGSKTPWITIIKNIFGGIGYITGMPFKTIINDGMSILKLFGVKGAVIDTLTSEEKNDPIFASDDMEEGGMAKMFIDLFRSDTAEASTGESEGESSSEKKGKSKKKVSDAELGSYGYNQDLVDAAEEHFQKLSAKAAEQTSGMSGNALNTKLWDILGDGYSKAVEAGNFGTIYMMREAFLENGGDANWFDAKITEKCKTAYKKTLNSGEIVPGSQPRQDALRIYMQDHGVTDVEISDICYHSLTARDLKAAMRMGNEQYIQDELSVLLRAGLLQEDYEKLWKYRNYGAKSYDGKYSDPKYKMSTGTYNWPISGEITSNFGHRSSPGGIGSTNHMGVDIAGSMGDPIGAADAGVVTYVGWYGGAGNTVFVQHDDGTVTQYSHMSCFNVQKGDQVSQGQQIGQVGSTGNSTGPHLHFGVMKDGQYVDPLNYLNK